MALADFLDRIGGNFMENVENAGPQGLASLGAAIASAPRRQWGAGLAQGIAQFKQAAEANKKKKTLAEALKGMSEGMTPQQMQFLEALDPNQAAGIMGERLFAKPSERWEQVDTNGDGRPDRQRSSLTGRIDDIPLSLDDRKALAAAGRSSVTVNNLPAEVGARIGLGEGFLRDFDSIKARAKKFYGSASPYDQVKRRGQVFFNTGEGGKLWADVETGKEALIRQLTGAGMAQAEAENQVSRYALSPWDTEFDVLQKLDRLRRDLENTAIGVYRGRGGVYTPPESGGGDGAVIRYDANGNRIQ